MRYLFSVEVTSCEAAENVFRCAIGNYLIFAKQHKMNQNLKLKIVVMLANDLQEIKRNSWTLYEYHV